MFLVLRLFFNIVHESFITDKGIDPRMAQYPLLATPWVTLCVIAAYFLFVLKYGPALMKGRKPFKLKNIVSCYNACQVFNNFVVAVGLLYCIFMDKNFSFMCHEVKYERTDRYALLVIKLTYLFYLTKYMDLLDTIFFTLRKKSNQASFLHVYHHSAVILVGYFGLRFYAESHGTITVILNALVHVVMYSYYFLTSFSPNMKNSIWWKKYITLMQLIQFFLLFVHYTLPLLLKDCTFPRSISLFAMIQCAAFTAMFSDFYFKSYIKNKRQEIS